MKRFTTRLAAISTALLPCLGIAAEQDMLNPDLWPQNYKIGESEVTVYQPQILEWTEYRHLKASAAIAVKLAGRDQVTFGATTIEADTATDFEDRTVRLGTRSFSGFRFPELDEAETKSATELIRSIITPEKPLEIPLDSVLAAIDRADAATGETEVNLAPPPIFYSDVPAILVVFIGEPKLEAVKAGDPSLMFAVNTNWDVLFDSASSSYFLLSGKQWLTTKDLVAGPWSAAKELPASFQQLPDDANWSEVRSVLTINTSASPPPKVFLSKQPSEIILLDGKPQFSPISGTRLMVVTNTEGDVFFHTTEKTYYFLTAGRWFSAAALEGPWAAATDKLPEDFQYIPAHHPKANVLVSVPGTSEADEAVIVASIPQTASVDRSTTTIQVSYDGAPQFKPVPGTDGVQFAVNTSYDVFLVEKSYYCCHQGVWFEAAAATGPWKVCDKVPSPIYTIPPQSPKHNVTYVYVYDSTPDTVQVGVTSGYSGCYIANGLVVFGLGYWLGHELADHRYYPSPYWYGYGCGAHYVHGGGFYCRGASYYGPYGGAGYAAAYNPVTGTFSRGAYAYGPRGAVGARTAYNPWTNTAAGRVVATTPYGSWGRSAVVRDDEWLRAGHRSNAKGTVAGIQGSGGGAAVGVDRRFGSDAFVGKSGDGDVYVGKDGNIYRKTDGGEWQKRENGGWQDAQDVPRPTPKATASGNNARPGRPEGGASGGNAPERPTKPLTKDGERPGTKPAERPVAAPERKTPAAPAKRPVSTPSERPVTRPAQRPDLSPDQRPAAKPTTRPSGGYKSNQGASSQLNLDSSSRERARPSGGGERSAGGRSGRQRR
jgi:hypothetical protein